MITAEGTEGSYRDPATAELLSGVVDEATWGGGRQSAVSEVSKSVSTGVNYMIKSIERHTRQTNHKKQQQYSIRDVQISAPIIGMPKRAILFIVTIDAARSFQVAALSPVQCAVCTPEPRKVDLERINGRRFGNALTRAFLVAILSMNPYKL